MGGHVKGEGLIEDRVQTALHCHCLLLLYTLVLVHQPHLHVRICNVDAECSSLHVSQDEDAPWKVIFGVRFAITLLIVKVTEGSREADT